MDDELVDVSVKNEETYIEEIVESKEEKVDFTKDDCVKILELLKKPTFSQLLDVLTMKEAIIFSLKLGFVDNKYFKTEAIAKFLGIREEEVIDVTKKALLIYRENFNVFLENIIEKATDEVGEARVLSLNKK